MDAIEKEIRAENWLKARKLIRAALKNNQDDHWLLTRLGLTYYEQYQYKRSLIYIKQALAIAPRCPLVLWDYAGSLEMLGNYKKAIAVYRSLVRRGVKRIAYGECGEGIASARGLICDCHYRLAGCYKEAAKIKEALKQFDEHLKMRGPGCRSIYSIVQVRKEKQRLLR